MASNREEMLIWASFFFVDIKRVWSSFASHNLEIQGHNVKQIQVEAAEPLNEGITLCLMLTLL